MDYLQKKNNSYLYWGILLLNAALFLIWPLAHTIALRKLLLVLAAIAGMVMLRRTKKCQAILTQPWIILFGMLLVWVVFHAAFISQNGAEAWKELLGQWIPAYVALFAGIGVGLASVMVNNKKFGWFLLACALALPVFYLLVNLMKWVQLGYLPIGYMSPTESNDVRVGTDLKMSLIFSLEMLVPFACVKLLEYWRKTGKFSVRSVWVLPIVLALTVAIVSLIKNLMFLLFLSLMLTMLIQGFRSKILNIKRLVFGMIGLLLTVFILVNSSSFIHNLWQRGVSDTRISLDIDNYQNWKNFIKRGLPHNEFGETLSETYYLRLAYAHAGLRAALETPWGYGVTRKAMERIEQQMDPEVSIANAHNGYLNLSCAVGIPALVLFVLTMAAVFWQLKSSQSRWAMPAIWMIGFYLLHWAIDPVERDHFLQLFMYVISLMLTLVLVDNNAHEQN